VPLERQQVDQIALAFGLVCSGPEILHIPETWLEPTMSDHVYGDFILKNGQMLALLVRTIAIKPSKREFALAVDERNHVFLVKRCELQGIFSKDLVIDIYSQDGTNSTLRLPMSALPPEQRKRFLDFLNSNCVRNLPNMRFDDLPARLFETHPNFSA
jgi:hypothetical protein